jgi:hypothetical protein
VLVELEGGVLAELGGGALVGLGAGVGWVGEVVVGGCSGELLHADMANAAPANNAANARRDALMVYPQRIVVI